MTHGILQKILTLNKHWLNCCHVTLRNNLASVPNSCYRGLILLKFPLPLRRNTELTLNSTKNLNKYKVKNLFLKWCYRQRLLFIINDLNRVWMMDRQVPIRSVTIRNILTMRRQTYKQCVYKIACNIQNYYTPL